MIFAVGGNSFNLVVLEPQKTVEDFLKTANVAHAKAVTDVSPHYYKSVRIHRLILNSSHEAKLERTLVKTFDGGNVLRRSIIKHHHE